MKRWTKAAGLGIALALCGAAAPTHAQQIVDDGQWHFSLTPYLWLPTINADLRFDVPTSGGGGGGAVNADAEIGPNDYLTNLNMALMLSLQARKGRWAIASDLIYLDLTSEGSRLRSVQSSGGGITIPRETDLDTKTDLSGVVWSLAGSYTVASSERGHLDVLGGMRYFGVESRLGWDLSTTITGPDFTFERSGKVKRDVDLYDLIVGLRGRLDIGADGGWYVPYYLDVGTGDSDLTWQAVAGVAYAYSRTDLVFAYRHLSYEQGDDELVQDLSFSGPAVGLTFRF